MLENLPGQESRELGDCDPLPTSALIHSELNSLSEQNNKLFLPRNAQHFRVHTTFYVRFEFFTAVTVANAVFWNIKTQLVPHMRHIFPYRVQPVNAM
jgi:hypothetical protein